MRRLFCALRSPFLFAAALWLATMALPVFATDIALGTLRAEKGELTTSLRIPGLVGTKTRARLSSGETFETVVRFYLYARRDSPWPDEELDLTNLRLSARYDSATEEYTVSKTIGKQTLLVKKVRSLEEARELLEVSDELPVFAIDRAWGGRKLYLRARVFLGTEYLLGMIPTEKWSDKARSGSVVLP